MRRREFITLVGGAAAAWPLAARAQQGDRPRRIGMLIGYAEEDPETKSRVVAFRQMQEKRGWSEGRNIDIEARFVAGSSGLLLPPDGITVFHRDLIVELAGRHRLPAVYPFHFFVTGGGLMSYGSYQVEMLRLAASYVDRIFAGAKSSDLPLQAPP